MPDLLHACVGVLRDITDAQRQELLFRVPQHAAERPVRAHDPVFDIHERQAERHRIQQAGLPLRRYFSRQSGNGNWDAFTNGNLDQFLQVSDFLTQRVQLVRQIL